MTNIEVRFPSYDSSGHQIAVTHGRRPRGRRPRLARVVSMNEKQSRRLADESTIEVAARHVNALAASLVLECASAPSTGRLTEMRRVRLGPTVTEQSKKGPADEVPAP